MHAFVCRMHARTTCGRGRPVDPTRKIDTELSFCCAAHPWHAPVKSQPHLPQLSGGSTQPYRTFKSIDPIDPLSFYPSVVVPDQHIIQSRLKC
jgi:hypothetical protein